MASAITSALSKRQNSTIILAVVEVKVKVVVECPTVGELHIGSSVRISLPYFCHICYSQHFCSIYHLKLCCSITNHNYKILYNHSLASDLQEKTEAVPNLVKFSYYILYKTIGTCFFLNFADGMIYLCNIFKCNDLLISH